MVRREDEQVGEETHAYAYERRRCAMVSGIAPGVGLENYDVADIRQQRAVASEEKSGLF